MAASLRSPQQEQGSGTRRQAGHEHLQTAWGRGRTAVRAGQGGQAD